ncbi:hypothetical protein ES708_11324 [subsurface metagenome]
MVTDLQDWYAWVETILSRISTLDHGGIAGLPAIPNSGDCYLATDTGQFWVCYVAGAWVDVTAAYLLLAGGVMTGAIDMGANQINNMADPAVAQDAATRAYVLAETAAYLLLAGGVMLGDINMAGEKVIGLGAPTVAGDALRYGNAEIRNAEIAAGAAIAVAKLVNTYFPETLMTIEGDLIIRGAANPERFAKPAVGQFLKATATGYEGGAIDAGEGHITIMAYAYDSIEAGTWKFVGSGAQYCGGYIHNFSIDDADAIRFKVYLEAGTYLLALFYQKEANFGICDIDIDEDEVATVDMYASSAEMNKLHTETDIAVATAGIKTITCRVDGKHASSTDYEIRISGLSLWRTA